MKRKNIIILMIDGEILDNALQSRCGRRRTKIIEKEFKKLVYI